MSTASPIVSVIVIFLNAERFIQEALESVFAQTYNDWELLLVDDGSTDGSSALALDAVNERPGQVRYLEHPAHENLGMSASRNLGIEHSRGEFIAFLDADDVWYPQKLSEQVAIMRDHPDVSVIYGNTLYWYSWSDMPADKLRDYVPDLGVVARTTFRAPTLVPRLLRGEAAVPCTCSVLIRRDALQRVGGAEDEFRGSYEDQALYSKLFLKETTLVETKLWDCYRQHAGASSAQTKGTGAQYDARRVFLYWLQDYVLKEGIQDAEVRNALHRSLWQLNHPRLARIQRLICRLLKRLRSYLGSAQADPGDDLPKHQRAWIAGRDTGACTEEPEKTL